MENSVSDSDKGHVNLKASTASTSSREREDVSQSTEEDGFHWLKREDPELKKIYEIADLEEKVFRLNQFFDNTDELLRGAFYRLVPIEIHPLLREAFDNDCALTGYASKCKSCGTPYNVPKFGEGALHKQYCPICSTQESKGRATRARELLYGYDWEHVSCLDLTTHSSYIDEARYGDEAYLIERQNDLMKAVRLFMKKEFPSQPYLMSFHYWHSSDPLAGWHFHVHLLVMCSRYKYSVKREKITKRVIPSTRRYEIEHLNPHLTRGKLKSMKRIWSELVEYEKSVLYYRYIRRTEKNPKVPERDSEFARVKHRLRYMFRGYVQDVNTWLNTCEELGKPLPYSDELKRGVSFHLREWKRRTVYCGALSPGVANKWVRLGNKKLPAEILHRIRALSMECSRIYCSVCYEELDRRMWYNPDEFEECAYDSKLSPLHSYIPKKPPDPCLREWVV